MHNYQFRKVHPFYGTQLRYDCFPVGSILMYAYVHYYSCVIKFNKDIVENSVTRIIIIRVSIDIHTSCNITF